jgi:hypothetical protein
MWSYFLFFPLAVGLFSILTPQWIESLYMSKLSPIAVYGLRVFLATAIAYIPTYFQTSRWASRDGYISRRFQCLSMWKLLAAYFPSTMSLESPLDHAQQYLFCAFPHGPISVNHLLTMTDSVGFLSEHYKGERRDLAASVLMLVPVLKDLLLLLGCVDASAHTAHHNMKKGRSILVFVGGEKEQLLSMNGEHKVYLNNRKGFVRLALQYGAHLVPMYCFGENECYTTSLFMIGMLKCFEMPYSSVFIS